MQTYYEEFERALNVATWGASPAEPKKSSWKLEVKEVSYNTLESEKVPQLKSKVFFYVDIDVLVPAVLLKKLKTRLYLLRSFMTVR